MKLNDSDGSFDLLLIYFCRKKGSQRNLETLGLEPNARKLIFIKRKYDRIGKQYKSGGGYIG